MKPLFARRKGRSCRSGRKRRACSKLQAFMLATLAAREFIQPALGQYTCPSSCNGLTLNVGTQSVNSGGVASGTTLNNVAQQGVFTGGVASATTVNGTGAQFVLGGITVNTTVNDSAFQLVSSGTASSATINAGASQYVSGGTVSSTTVNGGYQEIDGGTVTGTVVANGGYQNILGGSAAGNTILDSLQVINGGTATATVVSGNAAEQDIYAGSAVNTTVNGGAQFVYSGGVASATSLAAGGSQNVSSGGISVNTFVMSSGVQSVYDGGFASGTTVSSGGAQNVNSGGLAIGTTVGSGGAQNVNNGGVVSGTVVATGGAQNVASGGVAVNTIVSSGGIQTVSSGGTAQATVVRQGGSVVNDGTIVFNTTDTTSFDGALTGHGAVVQQGAGTTILTSDNHAFAGTTTVTSGTLMVGDSANPNASLGGNVIVASAGTLGGHGSIGNDVVNGGFVRPGGTIGTLSVNGNYTQTANGALVVEVSPTAASQLRVNGTAALSGTLQVLYDPGRYSARRYAILTANAISGKFGGLSAVVSSGADLSGLDQSVGYGLNEVDLLLAQTATTIVPLDTSIYTALGSTAVQGTLAFDQTLLGRFITAPAAAGAGTRGGTWAALTEGYARADGSGAASSFGAHRAGFAAGYDHRIGNTLVGGAVGYEHDEISETATPSSGRLDAVRLAAYGSRMFGAIETSGAFGYSFAWATDKRPLGTGSTGTPEGNHWLQSLSGTARVGIPLEIARDTLLEPRAGLRWAWLHGQGFAESGGGGQNLAVGADTVRSTQPYLELMLMHAFGTAAHPVSVYMDVEYARELANRDRSVTVFTQDGTALSAPGAPRPHCIASFGAGVRAQIRPSWSISGDASTQFRQGSFVDLQVSYRF